MNQCNTIKNSIMKEILLRKIAGITKALYLIVQKPEDLLNQYRGDRLAKSFDPYLDWF